MSKQKKVVTKFLRAAKRLPSVPRTTLSLRSAYGRVKFSATRRVAVFPELGLAYNRYVLCCRRALFLSGWGRMGLLMQSSYHNRFTR